MSYEDNQVGAIMDFELVSIRADVACEVVLRYLRRFDSLPDHTDKIFVVDENDVLQGVLPIRKLLVADPEDMVVDVMATEVVRFRPEDDVEEAAQAFERYDLVTAPVVDENKKLIGRITIDEMVDVIREESEADMLNMAGLQEEEDLFAPVWDSVKNRWMWLAINLCTAFIASRVIGAFEGSIEKIVALAALMPIVAGIGGNSGNQTITMIVRAMAMGQMTSTQAGRLLKKEVGVALVNGIIWGTVMGVISWLLYGNIGIGFAIPSNLAKKVADQLIATGTATHAYLGVSIGNGGGTADGVTRAGAEVGSVESGSPAETAGLRAGDVITAIDGHRISSFAQLQEQLSRFRPGDAVQVTVNRKGAEKTYKVTLRNQEGGSKLLKQSPNGANNRLGATLKELGANELRAYGLSYGLVVQSLQSNSALRKAGVREGFVLLTANNVPLRSQSDLNQVVSALDKAGSQSRSRRSALQLRGFYPETGEVVSFVVDL